MLDLIRKVVFEECSLNDTDTVLVGVSGGADSLCLMHVLSQLGLPIVVAHLNHGLRPEAESETQRLKHYTEKLGVMFLYGHADVQALANSEKLTIEAAARKARYEYLFSQARRIGAQAVAVGHTADDQIETVLMHLLRGAGLTGLKGMARRTLPTEWSEDIPLVRPLLAAWRAQVMEYVLESGYQPVVDASNLDTSFTRNRIRHELIPFLEGYNPGIRGVLWRTAMIVQEDYSFMAEAIENAWHDCMLDHGVGYIILDHTHMQIKPDAIVRYVIRKAFVELSGQDREFDYVTVDRALHFIRTPNVGKQIDLNAGIRMFMEGERLWLAARDAELPRGDWPQLLENSEYHIEVPGELRLADGWVLRCDMKSLRLNQIDHILQNPDPYQLWIDAQAYRLPFVTRARAPGDRIEPMGMEGNSMKVSDIMINNKIPVRARARWPLVYAKFKETEEGEIVWVTGYRQSHRSRVTEHSTLVLHMMLRKV